MKASDIERHLRSLRQGGGYPEPDVDTFKAGNPDAEVEGMAVAWMSYTWALKRALDLGCNLFITHEPTFYDHLDADAEVFQLPGVVAKRRFLEESGLIILRCHDVWDRIPEIGIPDAWARFLGLRNAAEKTPYLRVYNVVEQTAIAFARQLAQRLAPVGQPGVQLLGPAEKTISRVAVGTGAITPVLQMLVELHADAVIATDDGIEYWRDGALAIDLEIPIFVVNHSVSELVGMEALADHLKRTFPALPVHHIPQTCMYSLIPPGPARPNPGRRKV